MYRQDRERCTGQETLQLLLYRQAWTPHLLMYRQDKELCTGQGTLFSLIKATKTGQETLHLVVYRQDKDLFVY